MLRQKVHQMVFEKRKGPFVHGERFAVVLEPVHQATIIVVPGEAPQQHPRQHEASTSFSFDQRGHSSHGMRIPSPVSRKCRREEFLSSASPVVATDHFRHERNHGSMTLRSLIPTDHDHEDATPSHWYIRRISPFATFRHRSCWLRRRHSRQWQRGERLSLFLLCFYKRLGPPPNLSSRPLCID